MLQYVTPETLTMRRDNATEGLLKVVIFKEI